MSNLEINYLVIKDSEYRKIKSINYCCDKMKAYINPKYITTKLIKDIKKRCPFCNAKIILKEVKE